MAMITDFFRAYVRRIVHEHGGRDSQAGLGIGAGNALTWR
jgi:hypothetical protein